MIPQTIWIVLIIVSLMLGAYEHGKPRKGNNSVWTSILSVIFGTALLYWGGFFDCMFK